MQYEPAQLRAGITWGWTRSDLTDYPSPSWVLTYYLKNASSQIQIVAASDGNGGHAVAVTPASNGAYAAGRYDWIALVASGGARHEVSVGSLEILPNVVNTDVLDQRGYARKALEMIEAYLSDSNNLAASSYTIGTRTLARWERTALIKERDRLKAEIHAEETADRLRKGLPARNRILTRG